MEPIPCPETLVNNYHTAPRNIAKQRRSRGSTRSSFVENSLWERLWTFCRTAYDKSVLSTGHSRSLPSISYSWIILPSDEAYSSGQSGIVCQDGYQNAELGDGDANLIPLTYMCISPLPHQCHSNSSRTSVSTVWCCFMSSLDKSRPTYRGHYYLYVTGHMC
jgi:hypothetical protein